MKLDSRVQDKSKRGLIRTPYGQSTRIFCVNCGRPGGLAINEEAVEFIIYVCDLCTEQNGKVSGLEEVIEEDLNALLLRR